ncbi:MAG: hypothetical protein VB074_14265 [Proteiniphilum sp.]|jgi:hypothetical protein|uniref:hypothetical protein n=1 Tax=Proteiniphilum sp. TaxID=1926877 RepID=UPI002B1FFF84|nr:hypothetical protein [Proteiniphilum sp.]MEA5129341.1 hypothetical protein [Proteiniphilum sp.]
MTVETRKLNLIEEFIKITDEDLITRMEELMLDEKRKRYEQHLTPMSMEAFRSMIEQSKNEIENGLITTQEDLKKEIKSW